MPKADSVSDHVEDTIRRMADLHAEHAQQATPLQREVVRLTAALARPGVLLIGAALAIGWIAYNTAAPRFAWWALDPPPFSLLASFASIVALFMTVLILATQRREEEFTRRRAQLTLQLAALSEQKIAKVISLIEEQRTENPLLRTRDDPEASEMAKAADPRHVLDRIIETHEREPEQQE